ncbi:MAG: hypothetical protein HQL55_16945, partial [Magnetococcales bacterium]|nr:hypothetical protein [Magnetococcales bacterium]
MTASPFPPVPLIDRKLIQERIQEMARQIESDLAGTPKPVLVIIMKGGMLFGADLLRALHIPMPVAMIYPRWGGEVLAAPGDDALLTGADLILVDVVMDDGESLMRVLKWLNNFQPTS